VAKEEKWGLCFEGGPKRFCVFSLARSTSGLCGTENILFPHIEI
jgi:hypothetical protein